MLRAVLKVMRFWLDMGVDGMRLDAIPYLIEREGTNCENLPESHEIVKKIRREMDAHYQDKMLLAEANQWPADVLPYFGDGDECQMSFHFPLMPRIYMALRQEDRHPIVEIMRQTPEIPPECQWAIFLRNHDELTLEMVTDQERDYMYREYAADPRMRLNLGIRRRLAPLIGNSRLRIELLNSLLLSLPGTPVLYYGDEIGMGDNIYLGDRNGVRTPMQWTGDRNAGFSRADFHQLYSPPIIDPVFGYQAINVEAQQREASSLLNWMKRIIALRKRFKAFGRGSIEFLSPANRKIIAYIRRYEDEIILCVANLSRFVQPVSLDLSEFRGYTPVELFGRVWFPVVSEGLYSLTIAPTGFIWFQLERNPSSLSVLPAPSEPADVALDVLPTVTVPGGWETLMEGKVRAVLERAVLPRYMTSQRWFGAKAKTLETVSIRDWSILAGSPEPAFLVSVRAYDSDGKYDVYAVPIAVVTGLAAELAARDHPKTVLAGLKGPAGEGLLVDATLVDEFCHRLLNVVIGSEDVKTQNGRLRGEATSVLKKFSPAPGAEPVPIKRGSVEQSNTTLLFGSNLFLKMFRRLEPGENPDFEIGRFLTEKTTFPFVPKTLGAISYKKARNEPTTLAILQELVPNQGQGWEWVLGVLSRYFEQVASETHRLERIEPPRQHLLELSESEPPADVFEAVGSALRSGAVLGTRTGEMHLALASRPEERDFAPEPLESAELREIARRLREQSRLVFQTLKTRLDHLDATIHPLAERVLREGPGLVESTIGRLDGLGPLVKIRCHGDYHLGQVLWRENDFIILDFEGEPGRSLSERRAKQSPLKDVAGMLRSFDYAVYSELTILSHSQVETFERLEPWARIWRAWTSAAFLWEYREAAALAALVPIDRDPLARLLDFFVLEKVIFELRYEMNYRPDWVRIPLLGIVELLGREEAAPVPGP